MLQKAESRETAGRVRSLKQFDFQSLSQSLQRLQRCYRWWKTVAGAHSGDWKIAATNGAVQR